MAALTRRTLIATDLAGTAVLVANALVKRSYSNDLGHVYVGHEAEIFAAIDGFL